MKHSTIVGVFALLSSFCAFAQQVTVTAGAYKDCTVSWREQGAELDSLLFMKGSALIAQGVFNFPNSPVELRIPKSDLVSHMKGYDHSGLWTGDLSPNYGSVRRWGEVAAKGGQADNGDPYLDMSIHFDVCQVFKLQDTGSDYIVADLLNFMNPALRAAWHLEPGETFTLEKKGGVMHLKALWKGVKGDGNTVILHPIEMKKEHGLHGPLKYQFFIVASCKQENCQLWNDVEAPRTAFPQ